MGKKRTKKLKKKNKQRNQTTNQKKRQHEDKAMKYWFEKQREWQTKSNIFFYLIVLFFVGSLLLSLYLLSDNVQNFLSIFG